MVDKRKRSEGEEGPAQKRMSKELVNPKRVQQLKGGEVGKGPVIYWCSRDQRAADNWALLYAAEQASRSGAPVAVAFNLVTEFLHAGARQFVFMLKGLRELEAKLAERNVKFFLLKGDPAETVPRLVEDTKAALLVTDFSPLRLGMQWRTKVAEAVSVPVHVVDAHNIVPVWEASDKREYGARTIRSKIHKKLPEFMKEYPELEGSPDWTAAMPEPVDWDALIKEASERGSAVPEVAWAEPGEDAAARALRDFLSPARLRSYDTERNNPAKPGALSGLSPYFHFGQLAPQRAAIEAAKHRSSHSKSVESFLEESVVRRELSDNYCYYNQQYDDIGTSYSWVVETLKAHEGDKRDHLYSRDELEWGKTHDELWNAAQNELVHLGKMHGFMRMYWAKKILEWTSSPEEAKEFAIYLNDKWSLDGRDPNGYVGVMWSIAGLHDQGWKERPVFGKIRYMNYEGCKRKFDIDAYCRSVKQRIKEAKAKGSAPAPKN
uniref:Deoxyribodipyrimidine photo-lyase n=1 Tax=Tetraselmis sp. GSL018 TaxID=582737 RepID=A0A061RV60_9CHLO|mmetsp:Transcript_30002/g.71486  ORF Transcript_30002/g.71486 Transcript_30002/m.71486 type:complete len:491 (-) Transcript_30002:78-1550(-)|eukprot:CAMPEP_0177609828 /NCGR_PEP_ID=MMETSP0419_2-20121207/19363_1 /TAXON_ID=582737 /ORGANISM="Tetraselmis sp., Strain GSL018" /LENGTH=490 /DNA_ID=CAMNT_0019104911 /DNA_START=367 /DNA_END=1839 /DNA_ORIENTATION=-